MFGRQITDPYAETIEPDLCLHCDRGDHDRCDGTVWSAYLNFPTVCECDPDNHEQDPLL
jgi:hypothetical protein